MAIENAESWRSEKRGVRSGTRGVRSETQGGRSEKRAQRKGPTDRKNEKRIKCASRFLQALSLFVSWNIEKSCANSVLGNTLTALSNSSSDRS